jgi:RHS repeat-associated protein
MRFQPSYSQSGTDPYSFQAQEHDDELKGDGNGYNFDARMLDSRLGRWLSLDPSAGKYAGLSPYNALGNNPLIYIDLDGRDIVSFDATGKEIKRVTSKTIHKAYVQTGMTSTGLPTFAEATMPTRILHYSKYEKAKGRDYNKYDYEIAAQTYLFNKNNKEGKLPDKSNGGDPTNTVPELNPNTVKAIMMKETSYGYITSKNGDVDVMQVNVNGDWSAKKSELGLTKGVTGSYSESISAGIIWLYWKGVTQDDKGNVTWNGGNDWSGAVEKYNGGGDSQYMSKYKVISNGLAGGVSYDGYKEAILEIGKSIEITLDSGLKELQKVLAPEKKKK